MTNNKQERQEQRLAIINEALEPPYSELMVHIQQHVVNEFMDEGLGGEDFYINNEEGVHYAFNTFTHLGQDVVDVFIKSNKCGLSIKSVNEVLYEYKELALDMDLDMGDDLGHMVNCIMFNIANGISGALEFE